MGWCLIELQVQAATVTDFFRGLLYVFPNPPMVAHRKDKSLKEYLVRARIPSRKFDNHELYTVGVEGQHLYHHMNSVYLVFR